MSIKHRLDKLEATVRASQIEAESNEVHKVMWFYMVLTTQPDRATAPTNEELRSYARQFWRSAFKQDPPDDVLPYYHEALRWVEEQRRQSKTLHTSSDAL